MNGEEPTPIKEKEEKKEELKPPVKVAIKPVSAPKEERPILPRREPRATIMPTSTFQIEDMEEPEFEPLIDAFAKVRGLDETEKAKAKLFLTLSELGFKMPSELRRLSQYLSIVNRTLSLFPNTPDGEMMRNVLASEIARKTLSKLKSVDTTPYDEDIAIARRLMILKSVLGEGLNSETKLLLKRIEDLERKLAEKEKEKEIELKLEPVRKQLEALQNQLNNLMESLKNSSKSSMPSSEIEELKKELEKLKEERLRSEIEKLEKQIKEITEKLSSPLGDIERITDTIEKLKKLKLISSPEEVSLPALALSTAGEVITEAIKTYQQTKLQSQQQPPAQPTQQLTPLEFMVKSKIEEFAIKG
ncbi:hypothetical protein DRN41_08310, partial [Thermococci archaeon]